MPFSRDQNKFLYTGMDVHHPPDMLPDGRCVFMFNLQADHELGALRLRPPINVLASVTVGTPDAVHSIARLNDSVSGLGAGFSRFIGSGHNIWAGSSTPLTQVDTNYSGNPLAFVPYRPAQSPAPWLYTYDSARQQRFRVDGTHQNIGIQAPTAEPGVATVQPLYATVDNNSGTWTASGAQGGTIGSYASVARVPAATTMRAILFDSGSTGMATISPVNAGNQYAWMALGTMVILDGIERVVIEQVNPGVASPSTTSVQDVTYDTAPTNTGLCTIVPTIPLPGLMRNQMLQISGAYYRVLSVIAGPDTSYSFRVNSGGNTIGPGAAITGVPSFRAWCTNTHSTGGTIAQNWVNFLFTPAATAGDMSGYISIAPITTDLTHTGLLPFQNEDYMHLSLAFDHPEWVTEVHLLLDVDSTTNDFQHNYYYYVLRQGDFNPSAIGVNATLADQSAAVISGVTNLLLDQLQPQVGPDMAQPPYPLLEVPATTPPGTSQAFIGQMAATEVMFKLNDLTRVGNDQAQTLRNVAKVGLLVFVSGGIVNTYNCAWWVGGGYGPDCNFNQYGNQNPPIQWRYRYRNSLTGAHSTVSPETRNGELLRRQAIYLTCPNSPDSQVDTVDWERRGGSLPDWHYVGTVPQGTAYLDNITEGAALIGDPLEITCYQPWAVTDRPRTGTAKIVGTRVTQGSGDTFNLRWIRGTEFIVNGQTYSLYAPPDSTTTLTLAQSVVPPTGTYSFQIPEATIEGNPLYGAWLDESNNRVLAVGDPLNPGLMYYSNIDNPDGVSDSGYIEITSPSEPLMNGFYAEGANYTFSSTGLYRIENSAGGTAPYVKYRLSGIMGLAGNWAFDALRTILFYWGLDGIYAYQFGAQAENLTSTDLYPMFPQAGAQLASGVPISIHGVTMYPPNYAKPQLLRMCYADSFIYASYQATDTTTYTLVYSLISKGWRRDYYTPVIPVFHQEEGIPNPGLLAGGADNNLYILAADTTGGGEVDAGGQPINWTLLTGARNQGDARALKQYGDLEMDYATGDNTNPIGMLVSYDYLLLDGVNPGVPLFAKRQQQIFNLIQPPQTVDTTLLHWNIALALSGSGAVFLYGWDVSFLPLPEDTTARVSTWQTSNPPGYMWVNGVVIHANTFGQGKQVFIEYDNGQQTAPFTVTHNGEQRLPYYVTPFFAHEMRIVPVDSTEWMYWDQDTQWIGNAEPETGGGAGSTTSQTVNWTNGGTYHYKYVQGIRMHVDTGGVDKKLQVVYDGGIKGPVITVNSNGENVIPVSWPVPFKAHIMQLQPLDGTPWRYWNDSEWIYQLEPEPANYWVSQPNALALHGWSHAREIWLAYATASAGALISVIVDNAPPVTISPLDGLPVQPAPDRIYLPVPPLKGKYWQLTGTGTGLQLYERDIEFMVKSWASTGPYLSIRPFGDDSGAGQTSTAKI
jgi:hypothetical protein